MALGFFISGLFVGIFLTYHLIKKRLQDESNNRKRLAGKYAEKFVPFMDQFKYAPEDSFFLGMPIDYIVFDGLNEDEINNIIFVEVKSSESKLSLRQQIIRDAILNKRVLWKEIRI